MVGISLKKWFTKGNENESLSEVDLRNLFEDAAKEYQIRQLAFNTCVNLIANAISKCEFKTYANNAEIKGQEYYLWNIEPNVNQNSTMFLHKLIYQLYRYNEALVISSKNSDGSDTLAVADSFKTPLEYPVKMQIYEDVVVGEVTYRKTFKENEVLHFKLNNKNIKDVLDLVGDSFARMAQLAMSNYSWASGKHWKVHVEQIGNNNEDNDWNEQFMQMITNQVKPFFNSDSAILPEFDGYKYENIGGQPDAQRSTRDIKALTDDIFEFTARAFCIPTVLLLGDVAGTEDATKRWLTTGIDPLCDQLQEEANRKRYGFNQWSKGNFIKVDTSGIMHFDIFASAANIEKLVGSGTFSINEVRVAAGQVPINESWANEYFMTKNISTVENQVLPMEGGV